MNQKSAVSCFLHYIPGDSQGNQSLQQQKHMSLAIHQPLFLPLFSPTVILQSHTRRNCNTGLIINSITLPKGSYPSRAKEKKEHKKEHPDDDALNPARGKSPPRVWCLYITTVSHCFTTHSTERARRR